MNEQTIGEVAGEVWRFIDRNGGRTDLNTLRSSVRPKDGVSVELGTGWLAREGKLYFTGEHGAVQVAIKR